MRDLLNRLHLVRAISPAAAVTDNTAFVSQIIDLAGYEGCVFAILAGAMTDVDATIAATMSHGDASNLSDAVAVPAAQMTGTLALAGLTFADDDEPRKIGYVGSKRYVRLTLTPTGNNSGNIFLAVLAILGAPRYAPTANPPI